MRFQESKPDVLTTPYGIKSPNIVFAGLCFLIGFLAQVAALDWFGWEADAPPWAGFLIGYAGGPYRATGVDTTRCTKTVAAAPDSAL